jgi:cobalt-zinc-cadmium efflux system outer membrane protein
MKNPWPVALPPIHSRLVDQKLIPFPPSSSTHLRWLDGVTGALLLGAWLSFATPVAVAENPATPEVRVVTVDELINTVLQNNTGLNAARRAIDIATAGITTASAYPNPRLELNGGRGSAITPGTTSGNIVGVGVSQLIENPAA